MSENGTMKRRPQLSDSIEKLDEMVEGLSAAIPAAVAESVREALGGGLAGAIRDAVREAVAEGVRQALAEAKPATATVPTAPAAGAQNPRPKVSPWAPVRGVLARLRRWAWSRAVPVLARLAVGWAAVKLVGGTTLRSRPATLLTALAGTGAGLLGFAAGPVASAVLLGLVTGAVTSAAVWAAPVVSLFAGFREDWSH